MQHDTAARMSGDESRTGPSTEPTAQSLPRSLAQGLPRRPRSTSPAPHPREAAADTPAPREDDAQDTLCPDALARVMVAIQRGSLRARLAGPDDTDGRRTPPSGPGAD
ncbi:hypothetical protein [Streptomyces adelaidensis]|uniref:hypothetical protein n=1 Tax=Streptomyces adelaidensis TaxID=2796465 RepID=UPI0027DE905D|nr:hypothetical protein [Streptomyces adelaidensis]